MSIASGLEPAAPPESGLAGSLDYCARLTRRTARNFYYGLRLLPEPKRSAMFTLYAYMRLTDDIADAPDGHTTPRRLRDLDAWQAATREAVATHGGRLGGPHPIWPAFCDLVRRYSVPPSVFDDVIDGQRQDLNRARFETFDDLREYCRRVAGVVGLASICVWGYDGGAETEALAIDRGVAFQLTNILRDLREDSAGGRSYIPRAELAAFGLSEADLRPGAVRRGLVGLMEFQIARAREFYDRSAPLEARISRDSRATLVAMTSIYRGLLEKIAREPLRVMHERVSLSLVAKLRIGWKAAHAQ
jgi:phytoene synthase